MIQMLFQALQISVSLGKCILDTLKQSFEGMYESKSFDMRPEWAVHCDSAGT